MSAPISTSILNSLLVSGCANATATTFTHPLDVLKVRMQLQQAGSAGARRGYYVLAACPHAAAGNGATSASLQPSPSPSASLIREAQTAASTGTSSQIFATRRAPPPSVLTTAVQIASREGVGGFYKGLAPAIARSSLYGGVRLGLYGPLRDAMANANNHSATHRKVVAGLLSGATAAIIFNPIDLVKVRLMASAGDAAAAPGAALAVAKDVYRSGGLPAFWRGSLPSALRSSILTACQCAAYDETKNLVTRVTGLRREQFGNHLASALVAGVVTTTATTPVDVVRTNVFASHRDGAMHPSRSHAPWDIARAIYTREGVRGFFKGWVAGYVRIGPQTAITFVACEQFRRALGMSAV